MKAFKLNSTLGRGSNIEKHIQEGNFQKTKWVNFLFQILEKLTF